MKVRLSVMNFLEFAVWGSYLTCMGIYLGNIGLSSHIGSFYSACAIYWLLYLCLQPDGMA